MPQAPSPLPPVSSDNTFTGIAQPSHTSIATGNLPGGARVQAQAIPSNELVVPGTYSDTHNPVAGLRQFFSATSETFKVEGSSYEQARKANPTLFHLQKKLGKLQNELELTRPKDGGSCEAGTHGELAAIEARKQKLLGEFSEMVQATQHALEARCSIGLNGLFPPILRAGVRYREPGAVMTAPTEQQVYDQKSLVQIYRVQRLFQNVEDFLAEAALSPKSDVWCNLTSDELAEAWVDAGYHVYEWEPDDPESASGTPQCDREICKEWKEGKYDNERGTTFIKFNGGREWIVWLEHDRRHGYNLSKMQSVPGAPSEVYRILKKYRPEALNGLDTVFVAPPVVSNSLHVLKKITQQQAHRLLADHAENTGALITDIGFDEFGRFMHSRDPGVAFARYETHALDVETLGAALDASENSFLLMKMVGADTLQGKGVLCFDRPGMKASLNKERMKDDHKGDAGAPRSGIPRFERKNRTPLQYLDAQRAILKKDTARELSPKNVPGIPQGSDSRLYDASNCAEPRKFEMPSAILRQFVEDARQIGIISTGDLQASFWPDEAMLANMAASKEINWLVSTLRYAGVKIESPADLARSLCKTYAVCPEISVEFIKRYVEGQNDALPDDKKIKVTLEVKRQGQPLPTPDNAPVGYLIQYRRNGRLSTVVFYKSAGHAVFGGANGRPYYSWQLNEAAQYEGWQNEGPVSILRFEGEGLLPLVEVAALRAENTEESDAGDARGHKRLRSSGSVSEVALRPANKKERVAADPPQGG